MLTSEKLTSIDSPHFPALDALYVKAFPWHEQREPLAKQRALRDPLGSLDRLRRGPDHDHPGVGGQPAHQGGEELLQGDQVLRRGQSGGIEDEALGLLALGQVGRARDPEPGQGR